MSPEKIKLCHETRSRLYDELHRQPTLEEISIESGLEVEEVKTLLCFKVEEENVPEFSLRIKMTIKNHELEKLRLEKKLKQDEVADAIGIGRSKFSHIELCYEYPDAETQKKIADFFGSSPLKLFPRWLEVFSQKWKKQEKSRIVPVDMLQLSSPEVLSLASGDYEEMQRQTENSILGDHLERAMNKVLSPKEKEIVKMRSMGMTYEEVGVAFGVTRERVRQVEAKALERMRQELGKKEII